MDKKKRIEFKCWACGSNKLAYQKYAKCLTPVRVTNDGVFCYFDTFVEEDDYLVVFNGFCCEDCGSLLEHSGCRIETEKQLQCYFGNVPNKPNKEQGVSEEETSSESGLYVNEIDKALEDLMDRTEKDGVYLTEKDK